MIKKILQSMFESAMNLNRDHILKAVPRMPEGKLLDLGCDEGTWTLKVAGAMETRAVYGIEVIPARAAEASKKGVEVILADLAQKLPFRDLEFDVVHANQVIEHVSDVDLFAAEIFRVLKPGGIVIVSTENASSWHNVFALALGWQMFSLTNMSERGQGIGNPLALHRGADSPLKSWTHKVIFSHRGLKEFFIQHRFDNIKILGAGYYPLPSWVGSIDPRHAHFLTIVAQKEK